MGFLDKIFGKKQQTIAEQVDAAIGALPSPVPFLAGFGAEESEALEAVARFSQEQMIKMIKHYPEDVFVGFSDEGMAGPLNALATGQGNSHRILYLLKARLIGGMLVKMEWDRSAFPPQRGDADWYMDVGEMVMLAIQARAEAIATVRGVVADPEPHVVRLGLKILPSNDRDCTTCMPHVEAGAQEPLELVKAGLPPFHLGCRCMVQKVPLRS